MGLRLHAVPARQGWRWIVLAFALFRRRPLSFIGLFAAFMMVELLLMALVPVLGSLLGLAMVPMLSLGFMVASQRALQDAPMHAGMFADGFRHPDRAARRAQWLLCLAYLMGALVVTLLSSAVDGGSLDALMQAMAQATPGQPSPALDTALADPRLAVGLLLRVGLATLLSVPFWHAPALVHWGGQGAGQALFSSTLALWRTRGAFGVYALGWLGVMLAVGLLAMLAVALLGAPRLVGMLALPLGMALTAVFYISLWFSFCDSFGRDSQAA